MFGNITIPYGSKMLFNVVELKDRYTLEDVELKIGEICNVVKNEYGHEEGGFIAGQVFEFRGFVSREGTIEKGGGDQRINPHVAIVTYWKSFEQHERSHADDLFREYFGALEEMCQGTYEIGYDLLWQGEADLDTVVTS